MTWLEDEYYKIVSEDLRTISCLILNFRDTHKDDMKLMILSKLSSPDPFHLIYQCHKFGLLKFDPAATNMIHFKSYKNFSH